MATFTWPTNIVPQTATPLQPSDVLRSIGVSGKMQTRGTVNQTWTWTESYPAFQTSSRDGKALLAAITRCARIGDEAIRMHPLYLTTGGGLTSTPTVNGASQTGSSLVIAGVTGTNPVALAGEVFALQGYKTIYQLTSDVLQTAGAATLSFLPPIPAGSSPANASSVFLTGVNILARLVEAPTLPAARPGLWLEGVTLRWITSVGLA